MVSEKEGVLIARKSRKLVTNVLEKETDHGICAIYVRISAKNELDKATQSIENQKRLIYDYINQHYQFNLVKEYIDIGQTGTNFNRPGFEELMKSARAGQINWVIVKDLSRLGRNFLETCDYIENILPSLNIRLISITDGFDTARSALDEDQLTMPIKNMINEYYARDISLKTRSAKSMLRKAGCFIGGSAVFGYLIDPNNRHQLCVDPVASSTVQQIFDFGEKGLSDHAIAKILNHNGIASPAKYKYDMGIWHHPKYANSFWYSQTVAAMLENQVYRGNLVQGKSQCEEIKGKRKMAPKAQWDIVPNRHPPIITAEQFWRVQKIRRIRHQNYLLSMNSSGVVKNSVRQTEHNLTGKRYCANGQASLLCIHPAQRTNQDDDICDLADYQDSCGRIDLLELDLHEALWLIISNKIALVTDQLMNQPIDSQIVTIDKKMTQLEAIKKSLHYDWKTGIINKEEYLLRKQQNQKELIVFQEQIALKKSLAMKTVNNISVPETSTKQMIDLLIERIEVIDDQRIKVSFKCKDEGIGRRLLQWGQIKDI